MSSKILYPPVLDSYTPAFQAGEGSYCRVYFSLSKFNSASDFSSLHVSISKQGNGINILNTQDNPDLNRYRATGIILNVPFVKVEDKDNLFYFDILNEDLASKDIKGYTGWIPGWIYKIQIRLSEKTYDESMGQAAWLNLNSNFFSEWSTVCTTKAIGNIDLIIPPLNYDSTNKNESVSSEQINTLYLSTLEFFGRMISEDPSEVLYKYNLKLYNDNNDLLEDSGELYSNQYQNNNEFRYTFKYELQDTQIYSVIFTIITNNGYSFTYSSKFEVSLVQVDPSPCKIITIDTASSLEEKAIINQITSLGEEDEEGRIVLKLFSSTGTLYNGNLCIRRSSSQSNFKKWEDLKIISVVQKYINDLDPIYDYTVESGVFYQYGVQTIDSDGNRGILRETTPILRNFEYSYLLGENNQQLKLMFNNTMPNYKIQLMESKLETIGGIYPIVTRNAALNYRIFSINGLISFWMDENKTFTNKLKLYNNNSIINLYNENNNKEKNAYSSEHHHDILFDGDSPSYEENLLNNSNNSHSSNNGFYQSQYDYTYERDFRQAVLDFLHDGKPKLFKSPTEGNIIVRLTDITCVPNQSLSRMIYDFNSTANEFAENTYENYIKYNFLKVGIPSSDLSTTETKIGQIQMTFTPTTNIFDKIKEKYSATGQNYVGYKKSLMKIHHIKITINDKPLRIYNNALPNPELVLGNNISLNGKKITINGNQRIYEFDGRLNYTFNDTLYLLGSAENPNKTVDATIDFLYDIKLEKYEGKKIQTKQIVTGVGQIFNSYMPNISIYNDINYKYYIDWGTEFRRLNTIFSIEIQANPGTIFFIQFEEELNGKQYEIGDTGILRFYELNNIKQIKYIGKRNKQTGEIDTSKPEDILINYLYTLIKGTYKGE